jgi:hypothetical protein
MASEVNAIFDRKAASGWQRVNSTVCWSVALIEPMIPA